LVNGGEENGKNIAGVSRKERKAAIVNKVAKISGGEEMEKDTVAGKRTVSMGRMTQA